MSAVALKFIKPGKMNIKRYLVAVTKGLKEEAAAQRRELNRTTRSWKGDKPVMKSKIERGIVTTGPTGNKKGVSKWIWSSVGTKIRWAVMSSNWRSKGRPNKLQSRSGRGQVVIAGKRAMQKRNIKPRPGIKARNWPQVLARQRKRVFPRAMQKQIRAAAKGTF